MTRGRNKPWQHSSVPGTRWFRSPEAVSAGVLAAIGIATSAARSEQRWEYGPLADALLAGHGLSVPSAGGWPPSAFVEPYYPMLLAATTALAGPLGGGVMIALQIAALVLAARLVAGVASQRLGVPRGAAVLVVALWPPLVIASLKFHPQAFRALLLAALSFTLRSPRRSESKGSPPIERWVIAFGALVGACVWARSVYLVPAAVLAVFALRLASSWRAQGGRVRAALAVALVVAAPWWIRNGVAFGTFVPFTTNGGLNLAMGNHPGATGEADDDARAGARALLATPPVAPDEVAADRALGRAALSWIASDPVNAAAGWARKLGYLLVMRPGAGERYPRLLRWAYVLFACVTTPLLVWGAWRAPPEARWLLLAPALALLGAFAVFAVNQRYRFEADVLLAPFALAGAMHLARAWRTRARRSPWRRSLAAAACVALAVPAGLLAGRPDLAAAALVRDESARLVSVDAVFVASGDVDFHRTRHAATAGTAAGRPAY